MSDEPKKNLYVAPQIIRVELNHEQAILSVCSVSATTLSNGGNSSCRSGSCKNHTGGGGDAGSRAS